VLERWPALTIALISFRKDPVQEYVEFTSAPPVRETTKAYHFPNE
jgi:hypothetical protein